MDFVKILNFSVGICICFMMNSRILALPGYQIEWSFSYGQILIENGPHSYKNN